jgi:hypothetical protein
VAALRRISLAKLVWLALPYAAGLWWIHHLVRDPFNVDYFRRYVSLRCTAEQTARFERSLTENPTGDLAGALRACQEMSVKVDGVWGGILGRPSVRLQVLSVSGAPIGVKYYSVSVNPLLGTASIRYELASPSYYYLNP